MKVGIIGAGDIGQAYARHFLKVAYPVILRCHSIIILETSSPTKEKIHEYA
jgi:predicted dinucleotide-binding enzyme